MRSMTTKILAIAVMGATLGVATDAMAKNRYTASWAEAPYDYGYTEWAPQPAPYAYDAVPYVGDRYTRHYYQYDAYPDADYDY